MRAALRDLGDHSGTLVEVAEARDKWRWVRGRIGAFSGWLTAFLLLLLSFREQISAFVTGVPTGGP